MCISYVYCIFSRCAEWIVIIYNVIIPLIHQNKRCHIGNQIQLAGERYTTLNYPFVNRIFSWCAKGITIIYNVVYYKRLRTRRGLTLKRCSRLLCMDNVRRIDGESVNFGELSGTIHKTGGHASHGGAEPVSFIGHVVSAGGKRLRGSYRKGS